MKWRLLVLIVTFTMTCLIVPGPGAHAADKAVNLKLADMVPEAAVAAQCVKWWGSEIEKRTGGKVKFEYFFGGSLVGAYEQMSSVKNNVIQLSPYYSGYHPDIAPIPLMALFPFMNTGTLESGLKAADEFFRNNPAVQKEFKKNNVKYMNPLFTANAYMWSKTPIKSIADFKGMSVRGFGPWLALFKAVGCSLVSVPVPEIYNSLERGAVSSTLLYLTNGVSLNLFEVTSYLTTSNFGHNCGMPLVMNLDTWNKLPADVKKVIEEINMKAAISNFCRINEASFMNEMALVKEKGMKVTAFPRSDFEKMRKIAKEKVWEPYVKKLDATGVNGSATLKDLLGYVQKYK